MQTENQSEVIAFLESASTHAGARVERIDTHASVVFLAGMPRLEIETCRPVRVPRLFDGRTTSRDVRGRAPDQSANVAGVVPRCHRHHPRSRWLRCSLAARARPWTGSSRWCVSTRTICSTDWPSVARSRRVDESACGRHCGGARGRRTAGRSRGHRRHSLGDRREREGVRRTVRQDPGCLASAALTGPPGPK